MTDNLIKFNKKCKIVCDKVCCINWNANSNKIVISTLDRKLIVVQKKDDVWDEVFSTEVDTRKPFFSYNDNHVFSLVALRYKMFSLIHEENKGSAGSIGFVTPDIVGVQNCSDWISGIGLCADNTSAVFYKIGKPNCIYLAKYNYDDDSFIVNSELKEDTLGNFMIEEGYLKLSPDGKNFSLINQTYDNNSKTNSRKVITNLHSISIETKLASTYYIPDDTTISYCWSPCSNLIAILQMKPKKTSIVIYDPHLDRIIKKIKVKTHLNNKRDGRIEWTQNISFVVWSTENQIVIYDWINEKELSSIKINFNDWKLSPDKQQLAIHDSESIEIYQMKL